MDNKQLYVLLQGMISELDYAIAAAREALPEDAPKCEYVDIFGRTTVGDYEVIEPLAALLQDWQNRIEPLGTTGA